MFHVKHNLEPIIWDVSRETFLHVDLMMVSARNDRNSGAEASGKKHSGGGNRRTEMRGEEAQSG